MRLLGLFFLVGAIIMGASSISGCGTISSDDKAEPTYKIYEEPEDEGNVTEETEDTDTYVSGSAEEDISSSSEGVSSTIGNAISGIIDNVKDFVSSDDTKNADDEYYDEETQQSDLTSSVTSSNATIDFNINEDMTKAAFSKKVDGDTAYFTVDLGDGEEEIKVRFLAVDTPETVKEGVEVQDWGPEASDYTYDRLSNASEIYLEWDDGSDMKDTYDRYLAWVWVDGSLLEEELVERGLAQVAYIYGDYKYTDQLYQIQDAAKVSGVGIWSE